MLALLLLLPAAGPPPLSPPAAGDRMLTRYFRLQADRIGKASLADVRSKADWEAKRPALRKQFLSMMGLDPLPARSDLKATITGKFATATYRVEKLHFQSIPGLYVTGNLYLPLKVTKPVPAILYVCGHGGVIIGGVSYGNKVTYQHHGAWFAENGYVCLMIDTLQLGELQGLHHGTYNLGMWWWQALGYTPAGIELWNGIRAIDYLQSRSEVDKERIGVTGRSGGGATSWWIMAADERVKCGVPVAGIADLRAHLSEGYPGRLRAGVIAGHCDCMYFVNTHRWDFSQVMALCAPRPVLLGNSDVDAIFPVPGYRRLAVPVKRLYTLLGAPGKFGLLETKGPHKDTPELREGAFRWFNKWLKGAEGEVKQPPRPKLKPRQLRVLEKAPLDAINSIVHESFIKPARLEMPASAAVAREWWKGKTPQLRKALIEQVFSGWPASPPPLQATLAGSIVAHGLRLRAVDFVSEEAVPLRAWLLTAAKTSRIDEVVLDVCGEEQWAKWASDLGQDFAPLLGGAGKPFPGKKLKQLAATLAGYPLAFGIVAPRGIGPTRWGKALGEQHIRRRFALIGQTLDGQRVWDARRAMRAFAAFADLKKAKRTLEGTGAMAGVALYASLFEPTVSRVEMRQPTTTHRVGPTFLNVLRVLDLPQAVALATCEVRIEGDPKNWAWPLALQQKQGTARVKVSEVGTALKSGHR